MKLSETAEPARDEALDLGAEIVAGAGDDVAFAGGQRGEAHSGNFVGGLLAAIRSRSLPTIGDVAEFRFGGAGAESAYANAVGFHFFGQALCEQQLNPLVAA